MSTETYIDYGFSIPNSSLNTITAVPQGKTGEAQDMLKRPIKVGDKILTYGLNSMTLDTVSDVFNNNSISVEGISDYYNPRKCVVVTSQIESNEDEYPENFI